jgi:hypothetical protein
MSETPEIRVDHVGIAVNSDETLIAGQLYSWDETRT